MEDEMLVTVTDVCMLLFQGGQAMFYFQKKKLLREQIRWTYFQSNICGGLREAMEL